MYRKLTSTSKSHCHSRYATPLAFREDIYESFFFFSLSLPWIISRGSHDVDEF